MAGKWGSKKKGIRLGVFWDSLELNSAGTQARLSNARIRIERDRSISDKTDTLTWSGGAVANGTATDVNCSGAGAETIKTVTGQWVTLSLTKKVTSTFTAKLTGIGAAGGTLDVTATVTYPLASASTIISGGGGSLAPGLSGSDFPNVWADDDAPDWLTEPYIEHVWSVTLPGAPTALRNVPAWEVEVDLDGGRAPYAVARFKCSLDYMDESIYNVTNPRKLTVVQISAGWKYPGPVNQHVLFSGVITERTVQVTATDAYLAITAESYETILDYPSNVNGVVPNTATTVKSFYDSLALYRKPTWYEPGSNVAPDTAQLAEYRALEISTDDTVGDFFRSASGTLNQWLRGRLTSATPSIENTTDPYPYVRLTEIELAAFSDLSRTESLDEWANILRLTVQYTSGDFVDSKRRTYVASDVPGGTGAVRAQDITLNQKPPTSATLPANWAPALRWLRRINEAQRGSWQGSCRALWWIQPRIDGIQLAGNRRFDDEAGQVQQVTFLVDQGLMSVQWNVVHK